MWSAVSFNGAELPVAFMTTKLSQAQMAWLTIEWESHAVLLKYRRLAAHALTPLALSATRCE